LKLFRRADPSYEALRRRIIRETEAFLLYGIMHPQRTTRIPTIIVGTGRFHPAFAARFWRETLGIEPETPMREEVEAGRTSFDR